MNTKIWLLFFFVTSLVNAQTISYEKLDSLSNAISKLQLGANNLTYNDGKSDYELSFSDENFKVLFSTQLASHSVYRKSSCWDILALTENIDLSKATGITWQNSYDRVMLVRLYFPKEYLQMQLFENGKLTSTISPQYLEFFSKYEKKNYDLFKTVFYLCSRFQVEKGVKTQAVLDEEINDFGSLSQVDFIKAHPTALKAKQAQYVLSVLQKRAEEEKDPGHATAQNQALEKFNSGIISGEFHLLSGDCTPYCIIDVNSYGYLILDGIQCEGSIVKKFSETYVRSTTDKFMFHFPDNPQVQINIKSPTEFYYSNPNKTCKFIKTGER